MLVQNNNKSQSVVPVNLDKNERLVSLVAGVILVVYGFIRLPLTAVAALIGGTYFLYRAIKGYCPIYAQLGLDQINKPTIPRTVHTAERHHPDPIDTTLNQTFPTSDPPAWTMGPGQ
jgi:uncharacterized membrane protein